MYNCVDTNDTIMSQSSTTPIYLQIAETIRRQILSGELTTGSRLPAMRTVARHWGCTPGTVSRAYAVLTREGLVSGHRGQGTMVEGDVMEAPQPAWGWASLVNRAEGYLLEVLKDGFDLKDGENAISLAAAHLRERLEGDIPAVSAAKSDRSDDLHFVGSHDLLIELLARFLGEGEPTFTLSISYAGSLGGLIALARGEAELSGIHLWDRPSNSYNIPFVLRILPGRRILLVTLAHRHLGLIVPRGNPARVVGLADLAKPDSRFINRQAGSGTRVWLDAQLDALGLNQMEIAGYERTVITHVAVADAVAHGEASVGLGIYSAAASIGLDFIPLAREKYELVLPEELVERSPGRALIDLLRSSRMKETIQLLGGYDIRETGSMRWLS
jgi:molybdate-binding protein/DNA-binding transcriptional regulator YhcF (GntR family)